MRMAYIPISSRVPADVAEGLREASRRQGVEIQEVLERALRAYLHPSDLAEAADRARKVSDEVTRREMEKPRRSPGRPRKHPPLSAVA